MAEGNVQLKLQASLDLAFLRAQVASLGKSLKTDGVSVVATLNTKQLQKDVAKLSKEIRININDKALDATVNRIKAVGAHLKDLQGAENKVVIGVTAKAAVTQKDARRVRSGVYRSIMENGGKILLPVGLRPISQTAVNAFKADLQKKLGSINIKVDAAVGAMPTAGQAGASRRPSYLDAPAFKTELEKLSRATLAQLQKGASGLREGRTRTELERLLSQFAQTNPQGAQRTRDLNALREMLALGRYQQGIGVEARMASGGGGQGPLGKSLDTFARGLFRMLGMDPAQVRAERQARLMPPAINWQAQVPRRNIPIGPSSTGRALTGAAPLTPIAGAPAPFGLLPSITRRTANAQGVNAIMQGLSGGADDGGAGKLALTFEATRKRIDAILAEYFKVVEAQVRQEFGGAELRQGLRAFAYVAQALRDAEQRAKQARIDDAVASFLRSLENVIRMSEARLRIYGAQVTDLGASQRMLPGRREQLALPPAGTGRAPQPYSSVRTEPSWQERAAARAAQAYARSASRGADFAPPMGNLPPFGGSGGGRDRVTGSGEPPQPRGGALVPYAQRTDLPSGYIAGAQMARALGNADQYLRQSRVPLAGAIAELSGEFAQATKQVLLYGTAYKALAFFMDLPNQALNAATALQTFRNQLNAITGSADNANRSFGFIDGLANRFAVPLESARQGFVKLYASMSPAGFQASEIEGLFSGISKAAATFGLSSDKVDRVAYAFSQMASKGQIMAEELRGQLGDVLPGSLALFAKAAQMELPEFTKAMENGRFSGEAMRVVLNNVAILLNQQFAKGAEGAAKTLQGALNQMQNSLQKLYEAFEPLVNQVAQQAFPLISSAVSDATKAVQAFTATMGGSEAQAAQLTGMARQVYDTMRQLTEIGQAVVGVVASLVPVLGNAGRLFLFVTQQIARLINTPLGGALSNWLALTILLTAAMRTLALTGVLLLGRQLMMLVRQLALVAAGLRTTITLSASARLGLLGLGAAAVIAAIMAVGTALDNTNRKLEEMSARSRQTAQDLMAMAVAGDVASVTGEMTEAKAQAQSIEKSKQVLERLARDRSATVTAEEYSRLQSQGLASGLMRLPNGEVASTGGQLGANIETATRGWQEQLNRWGNAEEALDTAVQRAAELQRTPTLQAIPPAAVDAADAQAEQEKAERKRQAAIDKALRDAETFARQQGQLITATADHQSKLREIGFAKDQDLAEQRYEQLKGLIDAEYDYRLTRANEVQAVQLNLEKKLSEARLSSLRSIEMTELRLREARLKVENAQARRAAAAQAAAIVPEAPEAALPPGAPAAPTLPPPAGDTVQRLLGLSDAEVAAAVNTSIGEYGGPDPLGRTDVFANILARSRSGQYPRNLVDVVTQPGQYAPNFGRSRSQVTNPNLYGLSKFNRTKAELMNPQLLAQSVRDVDSRLYFKGISEYPNMVRGVDFLRAQGQNFFHGPGRSSPGRHPAITAQLLRELGGAGTRGATPASGPVFSMQRREQGAEFGVEEAQAEEKALKQVELARLQNDLLKDLRTTAIEVSDAIGQVLPLEQLTLENQLLEERNALMLQGAPEEFIQATERLTIAKAKSASLEAALNSQIEKANKDQGVLKKLLDDKVISQESYSLAIANSNDLIKEYKAGLEEIPDRLRAVTLETLNSAVAQLKNADALKAMQEAVGMVKGAVEGVMGSYKNFVGEVLKGGSLKDAAKRLQEALRDQAVTMFLDFAMKPMQKFLEDSLLKVFGLESEEQQRQKSLAKLQEQINLLSQIRDNTAKVSGPTSGMSEAGQSLGLSSYAGSRAGGISELPQVQSALQMASQIPSQINSLPSTMEQASQALQGFQMKTALVTTALKQQSTDAGASGAALQQNLGKTVSAIGLAAGAITSIAGGISQIKEGGISGVLGGIGSIFMGVGGALGGFNSMFPGLFAPKTAANGALWKGGFTPFANGGVVNGPTLGLVGEGKYNEAIVPLPDGRSIPVKMAGGQSAREAMSNGGMPSYAPSTVSFSFETTKINGVEYVSRDQLELAMASTRREAIKEGAKRGMSMTLDKIQQSPGTRRSIAMGRR